MKWVINVLCVIENIKKVLYQNIGNIIHYTYNTLQVLIFMISIII